MNTPDIITLNILYSDFHTEKNWTFLENDLSLIIGFLSPDLDSELSRMSYRKDAEAHLLSSHPQLVSSATTRLERNSLSIIHHRRTEAILY